MGATRVTSAVVTDLETRRRSTREITLDELLILSEVLAVPPVQLMAPLDATERLEVHPGFDLDAPEAVAWIAGDPLDFYVLMEAYFPAPGITEELLRRGGNVAVTVRQIKLVTDSIIRWDDETEDPELRESDPRKVEAYERDIPVLADRLMHLAARMEAWGYEPPGLAGVRGVLQRRGLPSTLPEWRDRAAGSALRRHEADRPGRLDGQG